MENIERIVNIVWTLDDPADEGWDVNSVFRAINQQHEEYLLQGDSEFIIETAAADATTLTCSLNRKNYEHGCYSAE